MIKLPNYIIPVTIYNMFDNTYTAGNINLRFLLYTELDEGLDMTRVYLQGKEYPIIIKEKL